MLIAIYLMLGIGFFHLPPEVAIGFELLFESSLMSLLDYLFGRHLATDEEGEQRVGVLAGIPMLGLDALGSAAYGPEAALTLL